MGQWGCRMNRRVLLKAVAASGSTALLHPLLAGAAAAQQGPGPQAGDVLVFVSGDRSGQTITAGDVRLGAEPLVAFARAPKEGTVRKEQPIILLRLRPDEIDPGHRQYAADGIVAYSAICTHQGCWVTRLATMGELRGNLLCPCHGSVYDPRRGAEVLDGPAPRPLATLPLALNGQVLTVAGGFIGRVGP